MLRFKTLATAVILTGIAGFSVRADEATTQPSESSSPTTKPAASGNVRVVKRWNLPSLTPEQKQKISDIHKQALADSKAVDQKEEDDIMAVLTDDQKAEIKKMEDDKKAESKAKRASKKHDSGGGDKEDSEKESTEKSE